MSKEMPERDWTGYRETCGGRGCEEPVAQGRLLCPPCAVVIDEIKADFYGVDSAGLFVSGGVEKRSKTKKRLGPTCCYTGCYEPRIPPAVFCHIHEGEAVEEDLAA